MEATQATVETYSVPSHGIGFDTQIYLLWIVRFIRGAVINRGRIRQRTRNARR